jgi:hypothetical protein
MHGKRHKHPSTLPKRGPGNSSVGEVWPGRRLLETTVVLCDLFPTGLRHRQGEKLCGYFSLDDIFGSTANAANETTSVGVDVGLDSSAAGSLT